MPCQSGAPSKRQRTAPQRHPPSGITLHRGARESRSVQEAARGDRRCHDMRTVAHAHQDRPEVPVVLRLGLEGSFLSLKVWDEGHGFDIRDYQAPCPSDHQEGGYGWLILHQLMDRVDYELRASDGRNCLTLEKALGLTVDYSN